MKAKDLKSERTYCLLSKEERGKQNGPVPLSTFDLGTYWHLQPQGGQPALSDPEEQKILAHTQSPFSLGASTVVIQCHSLYSHLSLLKDHSPANNQRLV